MIANTNSPHTQKWAQGLSKIGIEVHLFSIDPIQKELEWRRSLHSHFAPKNKDKFLPRKYLVLYRQLKNLLAKLKPDIVHAHYLSNYATLAALSTYQPLCLTAWGSDVYQYPKQNLLNKLLLKWVLQKAQGIISTSEAMKQELLNYTSKSIAVIPFGIDFSAFEANQFTNDTRTIRIGIFKRLEKVYGIDTAIRAFALLQKELPLQELQLSIIGSGSQEAALKQLAQDLGCSAALNFIPWCEPNLVPAMLQQQNLVVYLSARESFGVALIEAMAAGKHLVVSDIPAFREVGEGYEAISYVQANNMAEIVTALKMQVNLCINEVTKPSNTQIYRRYDLNETIHRQVQYYATLIKTKPVH